MRKAPFEFKPGQRLWFNGAPATVCQVDSAGQRHIRLSATNQVVKLSEAKLARLSMCGVVKSADPTGAAPDESVTKESRDSGVPWHKLSKAQQARIRRRIKYVKAVETLYPISPNNPLLPVAVMQVAKDTADDNPPSPHSVYRWLRRYVKAGCDVGALAREVAFRRQRRSRLPAGAKQQLAVRLMEALGANPGASISGVFNDVMQAAAEALGLESYKDRNGNVQYVTYGLRAKTRDRSGPAMPKLP